MNVYFISGLGADERAFLKIKLPPGYEMKHIPWLPVHPGETLQQYCKRLAAPIDAGLPFMLAGLSFGGIAAVEISKFLKPEKLILFSTILTEDELPGIYRMAGHLKLERFLPSALIRYSLPFLYWFFGPVDRNTRVLVASFLKQTDPIYLRWALGQISRWHNKDTRVPLIRIHGKLDKVFPSYLTRPGYLIKGAGHLSVLTNADEINRILAEELANKIVTPGRTI